MIESGRIPRDESIVVSITGNGYKTLEAVARSVEKPYTIDAALQNFDELYNTLTPKALAQAAAGSPWTVEPAGRRPCTVLSDGLL